MIRSTDILHPVALLIYNWVIRLAFYPSSGDAQGMQIITTVCRKIKKSS